MHFRAPVWLLLIAASVVPSRATTIWHGDPTYSHFSIATADDVTLRIEGDTFSINSAIYLMGAGEGFVGYQIDTHHTFLLEPDAGWEFVRFNGAATDRGSYRNTYPGGFALDTNIALAGLSFTERYENPYWGSGGSFVIHPFTPWAETYAIAPEFSHGLTVQLDQNLYVVNGSYLGTDVGFGFDMVYNPTPPPNPGSSVPDSGTTIGLVGLALGGLMAGRRWRGTVT